MVKARKFGFGGLKFGTNPIFIIVIIAVIFIVFLMKSKNLSTDKVSSKFGSTPSSQNNLAVVQWSKGYTTTKLPLLSNDMYWVTFQNTDMDALKLYKLQNGTFAGIFRIKSTGLWTLFTSPSLTTPNWTQVKLNNGLGAIESLLEVKEKDGSYSYAAFDHNKQLWRTPSLTNPTWKELLGLRGNLVIQLQDGRFAVLGETNNYPYIIKSLEPGGITSDRSNVEGEVFRLIQLKDGTFAGIRHGGSVVIASSLKAEKWKPATDNGTLLSNIIQLKDGSFIGVGWNGGLYTIQSLTYGKWTKVGDIGPKDAWLLEY